MEFVVFAEVGGGRSIVANDDYEYVVQINEEKRRKCIFFFPSVEKNDARMSVRFPNLTIDLVRNPKVPIIETTT